MAPNLPREFVQAMDYAPIGIRFGSCSAAVYLSRLVTVADIETDALWEYRREAARQAGFRAAWSAPIVASDGQVVGTFAVYRRQTGIPSSRDHELMVRMAQIAGIAIERRAAEDALRNSESKFRGLFESVMEGVYQTTRDGRILVANPAFVNLLGYSSAEELYQVPAGALYWYPNDRENFARRAEIEGELRNEEYVMRRKDGSMLVVVDNCRVVRDANGRDMRIRRHLDRHYRAQESGDRGFSSQGARASHAAIDRRRRDHHRLRRAHRLHESGRRKLDRMGESRSARSADRQYLDGGGRDHSRRRLRARWRAACAKARCWDSPNTPS